MGKTHRVSWSARTSQTTQESSVSQWENRVGTVLSVPNFGWTVISLARQNRRRRAAQEGSWWVHFWIFWIWNIYVTKISFFSFQEFENKIVGCWHRTELSFHKYGFSAAKIQKNLWLWIPTWRWLIRLFWVVFLLWLTVIQNHKEGTYLPNEDFRHTLH